MWYQCDSCIAATNSPARAEQHEANTGHTYTEEQDA